MDVTCRPGSEGAGSQSRSSHRPNSGTTPGAGTRRGTCRKSCRHAFMCRRALPRNHVADLRREVLGPFAVRVATEVHEREARRRHAPQVRHGMAIAGIVDAQLLEQPGIEVAPIREPRLERQVGLVGVVVDADARLAREVRQRVRRNLLDEVREVENGGLGCSRTRWARRRRRIAFGRRPATAADAGRHGNDQEDQATLVRHGSHAPT